MLGAGFTGDLDFIFSEHLTPAYFEKRFGNADLKLMAVSFSLGASVLCVHLAKARENSKIHCAIAACAPFDFNHSYEASAAPFNTFMYQPGLSRGLVKMVARSGEAMKARGAADPKQNDVLRANIDLMMREVAARNITCCRTVCSFDDLITRHVHGFRTASDYYNAYSPFQHLHKIEVPLLCIAANNDPITGPPPALRRWDFVCEANPNLLYVRVPTGGHLGFVRGPLAEAMGRPSYLEERLVRALDAAVAQPTKAPVRRDVPEVLEYYTLRTSTNKVGAQ